MSHGVRLGAALLTAACAAAAAGNEDGSPIMVDGLASFAVVARVPEVIQARPPFLNASYQRLVAARAWITDAATGEELWSGLQNGSTASVRFDGAPLPPALPVLVRVAMLLGPVDGGGAAIWSPKSSASAFVTGINQTDAEGASGPLASPAAALEASRPPGGEQQPGHLSFLRAECAVSDLLPEGADAASVRIRSATAFVTGAAVQTADPGQMLSASMLSVGGRWLGYGPGRGDDGWGLDGSGAAPPWKTPWRAHPLDWHDVTADVAAAGPPSSPSSRLAVALWGFGGPLFAQLWLRWEGTTTNASAGLTVLGTRGGSGGPCAWQAADGDPYLNATWDKPHASPFGQPRERPVPALWPRGLDRPGFVPAAGGLPWSAAVPTALADAFGTAVVQTKRTRPVALAGLGGGTGPPAAPASVTRLSPGRYFVDAGRNVMGGLNVTVAVPPGEASHVRVRLSEELAGPGAILFPMRTGNYYETLAAVAAGSTSSVFNLEYSVFRYAQIDLLWLQAAEDTAVSLWPGPAPPPREACGELGRPCPPGAEQELAALEARCAPGEAVSRVREATVRRHRGAAAKGAGSVMPGASAALRSSASRACVGRRACSVPVRRALRDAGAAGVGDAREAIAASLQVECEAAPAGETGPQIPGAASATAAPAPAGPPSVGVWTVQSPWSPADASFASSDASFDRVVELARYTLEATTADTFTDSNTRERRPYEADGLITGRGRLAWQREWAVARHSLAYVLSNPTWPTEWRQATPLIAEDVATAVGGARLAARFDALLDNNTMRRYVWPETGLVNWTTATGKRPTRDIVDWPQDDRDGFVFSDVNSVVNSYAAASLASLGRLRAMSGDAAGAAAAAARSSAVVAGMRSHLWNERAGTFCDGPCAVTQHSAVHSAVFPLWAGVAPPSGAAWPPPSSRLVAAAATAGFANMSVYGAWAWLAALTGPHGAGAEASADGAAATSAVRQACGGGPRPDEPGTHGHCWEHMIESGATMTMEAFTREEKPNLSWSHPWAAAAAELALRVVLGVSAAGPGHSALRVAPTLGTLRWARGRLSTPRGSVSVSAALEPPPAAGSPAAWSANVTLPPATPATVCAPLWWPSPPPSGERPALPDLALVVQTLAGGRLKVQGVADRDAGVVCTDPLVRPGAAGDGAVLRVSRALAPGG